MKVLYIGYFSELNNKKLFCSPAANNVCTYVQDVLKRDKNKEIIILNIARPQRHFSFYKSSSVKNKNTTLINSPSFGSGRVFFLLTGWIFRKWVKRFISRNLTKDDCIIFYHSLNTLGLEKYVSTKYNSILQVEEVYSEVYPQYSKFLKREYECINSFKKYIFVSDAFRKNRKIESKSNIILYGSYSAGNIADSARKQNSIIYSGNISKFKGIYIACDAMDYLPEYQLHIYGHGSEIEFKEMIDRYGQKHNIHIHKAVSQIELVKLLSTFSIGLNPLPNDAKFNDLTFPSKILMYLQAGLNVVSSNLDVIKNSPFSKYIVFSAPVPKDFASSIKGIKENPNYGAVEFIKKMDLEFDRELKRLIQEKA